MQEHKYDKAKTLLQGVSGNNRELGDRASEHINACTHRWAQVHQFKSAKSIMTMPSPINLGRLRGAREHLDKLSSSLRKPTSPYGGAHCLTATGSSLRNLSRAVG
jgi:hypothetical protein